MFIYAFKFTQPPTPEYSARLERRIVTGLALPSRAIVVIESSRLIILMNEPEFHTDTMARILGLQPTKAQWSDLKQLGRVELLSEEERRPHATVPVGTRGSTRYEAGHLWVRLDVHVPGLEEWDNSLDFHETAYSVFGAAIRVRMI